MARSFPFPKPTSWITLHRWLLEFQRTGKPIGDFEQVLPPAEQIRWARREGFEPDCVVREFDFHQMVLFGRWFAAVRRIAINHKRFDVLVRLQQEVLRATNGLCDEGVLDTMQTGFFTTQPHTTNRYEWPSSVRPNARAHAFMKRLQHIVGLWAIEIESKSVGEIPDQAYKSSRDLFAAHGVSTPTLIGWATDTPPKVRSRRVPYGKQLRWLFAEPDVLECLKLRGAGRKINVRNRFKP